MAVNVLVAVGEAVAVGVDVTVGESVGAVVEVGACELMRVMRGFTQSAKSS